MKTLVLGAAGFIGKHLTSRLKGLGHDVTPLDRKFADLEKSDTMAKLSSLPHFDCIFHLPAFHGAGGWPQSHKGEIFEKNVAINHNVFSWWRQYQPQAKMICCISSCSYPESDQLLKEEDYWQGKHHGSVSAFSFTKKLMVVGLEAFASQFGMKGTGLVFGTVYGPGADFFFEKAHVINALIGRFFNAIKNKSETVEVWGDGTQIREFVYIDDQVESLVRCIEQETPAILNVSSGKGISIRELVSMIVEVSGFKGRVQFNANKFKGVQYKALDISLARKLIGWTSTYPLTSLPEGIERTLRHLEQ